MKTSLFGNVPIWGTLQKKAGFWALLGVSVPKDACVRVLGFVSISFSRSAPLTNLPESAFMFLQAYLDEDERKGQVQASALPTTMKSITSWVEALAVFDVVDVHVLSACLQVLSKI